MDKVTNARRFVNLERWKSIITECRSSGMAVKHWCRENGICEQTYYRNRKRIREEMLDALLAPLSASTVDKPAVFRKLEVQPPAPVTQGEVVIHFGGAAIEIKEGASQQTIQTVLLALQNLCQAISLPARTSISHAVILTCGNPSMVLRQLFRDSFIWIPCKPSPEGTAKTGHHSL